MSAAPDIQENSPSRPPILSTPEWSGHIAHWSGYRSILTDVADEVSGLVVRIEQWARLHFIEHILSGFDVGLWKKIFPTE